MRIAFRTFRVRVATPRPLRPIETTKSDMRSLEDIVMAWLACPSDPDSSAGPSEVAAKVSSRVGSWMTPTDGRPSTMSPMATQKNGMPLA